MKVMCIAGSNRRGNTFKMVSSASNALASKADVEMIMLGDLSFTFCDGCLSCDDTGECHIIDDMKNIVEKIKLADALIIGTPARWGLMSGELKTFFDRLNPLASSELLSGKKAVIFAVGQSEEGSDDADSIRLACSSVETFCDNADIEIIDTVCAYGCLEEDDIIQNENVLNQCVDAALKLIKTV